MISKDFYEVLLKSDISFFTGVPDSLLKSILAYITDNTSEENNIVAANEGSAIGIGIGYHLATNKIPLIYMQNSGLGNSINPLLSLADKLVYSIPMILLIGWRGEPGQKDEPQHVKQGEVTLDILDKIKIKYIIMDKDSSKSEISEIINFAKEKSVPVAIVVRKSTFESYSLKKENSNSFPLTREEAINRIVNLIDKKTIIVSTTGMCSRELYEIRREDRDLDFLTVGGMGHASQIAFGIAIKKKDYQVICIDGDGSSIMHFGGIATIGINKPNNFKHFLINNGVHGSVGNQLTNSFNIDYVNTIKAFGYEEVDSCHDSEQVNKAIKKSLNNDKLTFLEIKVNTNFRKELGRPKTSPIQNKIRLMNKILPSNER
jgi:phosphonopyruvate decarboxylase|tara:strand:- start:4406 stop:5527 length:1122 start_codon:yes stop_codon:yes gene_type:complete